jgi:hypothetical protein
MKIVQVFILGFGRGRANGAGPWISEGGCRVAAARAVLTAP